MDSSILNLYPVFFFPVWDHYFWIRQDLVVVIWNGFHGQTEYLMKTCQLHLIHHFHFRYQNPTDSLPQATFQWTSFFLNLKKDWNTKQLRLFSRELDFKNSTNSVIAKLVTSSTWVITRILYFLWQATDLK